MNERSGFGHGWAQRDTDAAALKPPKAAGSSHTLTSEANKRQNHRSETTLWHQHTKANNVFLHQIDKSIERKYGENWIAGITYKKRKMGRENVQEAFYSIQQKSNSILHLSYRWSVRQHLNNGQNLKSVTISALSIEAYRLNVTLPAKTLILGNYCFFYIKSFYMSGFQTFSL